MKEFIKKNLMFIIPGAVFAVAAIVLAVVMNLPANKMNRYMAKASKAYSGAEYEKAATLYTKALEIKPDNFDAFLGKVDSLEAISLENEELVSMLNSFPSLVQPLTDEEKSLNFNTILEIYLHVPVVFANDATTRLNLMDVAYTQLNKSESLTVPFGDALLDRAIELSNDKLYEESLALFTDAKLIRNYDEITVKAEAETMLLYVNQVRASGDLDTAFDMAVGYCSNRYFDMTVVNEIADEIEIRSAADTLFEKVSAELENVSKLIDEADGSLFGAASYDISALNELDASEWAATIMEKGTSKAYFGAKDANGMYAGLVKAGDEGSYYFFYGKVNDGAVEGDALLFATCGADSFYLYKGLLENFVPCGEGALLHANVRSYTGEETYNEVLFATWKDGKASDSVTDTIELTSDIGNYFEGTFTTAEGVPVEIATKTDDYEILNVPEEKYLYCMAINRAEGYAYYIPKFCTEGTEIKVPGFN